MVAYCLSAVHGRDDLRAQDRLFRGAAGGDAQPAPRKVARAFRRGGGVDVVKPHLVDAADRLEGQRLELGLRAVADHRHGRARPAGARCFAAMAEVAAVRSAVRIVISDSSTG